MGGTETSATPGHVRLWNLISKISPQCDKPNTTMVSFSLPPINDNPDGSWGPSSSNMPSEYKFREIPYAPYSKSDKLGKFADWYEGSGDSRGPTTGLSTTQGTRSGPARGRKEGTQAFGSGTASAFAYFHVEDESSFSLVDSKATTIRRGGGVMRGSRGRGTSRSEERRVGKECA